MSRIGAAISKVAWIPGSEIDQADWLLTSRRLGAVGRCSQWWIGCGHELPRPVA